MSKKAAAKAFGVPRSTIIGRLGAPSIEFKDHGNQTLTTDEEKQLVRYCVAMQDIGYPLSKQQVLETVQHLLLEEQKPNSFNNSLPGKFII